MRLSLYKTITASLFILSFASSGILHAQDYSSQNLFYLNSGIESRKSFIQHADEISIVCPAAYQIDQNGIITGNVDRRVLQVAKQKEVKVMPLFASFDQQGIHKLLTDSAARKEAIRLMLFYAKKYGYYGWQFDMEHINFRDKDAFTAFFQQAADSLHKHHYIISDAAIKLDQPAPESGNNAYQHFLYENWRGAFDLAAIAKAADFISFMTYDQQTAATPPGPVAGLPWLKRMLQYLLDIGVPPEKISLGIPSYSDYWYPTYDAKNGAHSTRNEISYAHAQDLLDQYQVKTKWMDDQQVHYAYWEVGGVFNWLFMENARSFASKFQLAKAHKLRGISVWVLGTEDSGIWDILKKEARTVRIH